MAAWEEGKRHRSWAANANLARISAAIVFVVYCVWSYFETAPTGLTTLLGVAGGAWFGAAQDDKKKKDQDNRDTAQRAETTATRVEGEMERLTEVAEKQHPGSTSKVKKASDKDGDER